MKRSISIRFLLPLALLLVGAARPSAAARSVAVDGYAAAVNQRIITVGDIMEILAPAQRQLEAAFSGEELRRRLETAYDTALNTLIERQLILEEFAQQKLVVPDAMIDDQIREIVMERFGNDRAALVQALDGEQLSYEQWRSQIYDRIAVMMLRRREVSARLQVSPTAVLEEYERRIAEFSHPAEVQLRTIALKKGATEEDVLVKRTEAEGLLRKLVEGEDFADLARLHSEGAYAADGGAWGWVPPANLRREIAEAVEQTEVGQLGPLVETPEEFYLLRVDGRKAARVVPFEEVKEALDRELREREEARLYRDWIERLKRNHFVKIFEK